MDKVLIMDGCGENEWNYKEWRNNEIPTERIFRDICKPLRAIRRAWIKCGLPFESLWYRDFDAAVRNADTILFHVSYLTMHLARYINKINPQAKVIAWYWNAVDSKTPPAKIQGICQKWSFDPINCLQYNMKFNHQYYFKSLRQEPAEPEWDLYFCGSDAGRSEIVEEIYELCKAKGIKCRARVVNAKNKNLSEELVSERIDYQLLRDEIMRSKAILELTRSGQSGATIRQMEALFYHKKLVTDNQYIREDAYFDENNIFILGERPIEELPDFLDSKPRTYDESLLTTYDVRQWLERFVQDTPMDIPKNIVSSYENKRR